MIVPSKVYFEDDVPCAVPVLDSRFMVNKLRYQPAPATPATGPPAVPAVTVQVPTPLLESTFEPGPKGRPFMGVVEANALHPVAVPMLATWPIIRPIEPKSAVSDP